MANTENQTTSGYLKGVINSALDKFGFESPKEIRFAQDLYKYDRKFATFQDNPNSKILIVDEKLADLFENAHQSIKHKYASAVESAVQVAALYKHGVDEHKAELAKNADDDGLRRWGVGNGIAFFVGALGAAGNVDFAEQTTQIISNALPNSIMLASGISEVMRQVKKELPLHDIYKNAVHDVINENGNRENAGFETLNVIAKSIDRSETVIGNLKQAVNGAVEVMLDPEKYRPNFVQKSLNEQAQLESFARG